MRLPPTLLVLLRLLLFSVFLGSLLSSTLLHAGEEPVGSVAAANASGAAVVVVPEECSVDSAGGAGCTDGSAEALPGAADNASLGFPEASVFAQRTFPQLASLRKVERGTLLGGRFLASDLLHARWLWGADSAEFRGEEWRGFGEADGDKALVASERPHNEANLDRLSLVGEGWLRGDAASASASAVVYRHPTGASVTRPPPALTAKSSSAEGLCLNPATFFRWLPFWQGRLLLTPPVEALAFWGSGASRFTQVRRLGGGAYGEVWSAVDLDSNAEQRLVVLKRFICAPPAASEPPTAAAESGRRLSAQEEKAARERQERGLKSLYREAFFGVLLRGEEHVARYIGHFHEDSTASLKEEGLAAATRSQEEGEEEQDLDEAGLLQGSGRGRASLEAEAFAESAAAGAAPCGRAWLVFANEGFSLNSLFFTVQELSSGMLGPSAFWWGLRERQARLLGEDASCLESLRKRKEAALQEVSRQTAAHGRAAPVVGLLEDLEAQREDDGVFDFLLLLRSVVRQLLLGLKAAHTRGIVHRDVKLENIFALPELPLRLRLGDWGSAVGVSKEGEIQKALHRLFRADVSSVLEETDGYQPPEAESDSAFESSSSSSDAELRRVPSFDIWGVGLVFLELALGSRRPLDDLGSMRLRAFDQPAKERRARGRDAATRSVWLAMRSLCLTPWKTDRQPAVLGDTALQQAPQTPLALAPASLQRWSAQTPESAESRSAAQREALLFGVQQEFALVTREGEEEEEEERRFEDASQAEAEALVLWLQRESPRGGCFSPTLLSSKTLSDDCDDRLVGCPSETQFDLLLRRRDVSGLGVPNRLARDLLRRLLAAEPQERLTVEEALQHPWFLVKEEAAGSLGKSRASGNSPSSPL